ncbi:MAG: DUF5801 repeats-in-toxin domain-containing protein, partial [Alphaproteobacteria bacterium]
SNNPGGVDTFSYTLTDFDGDSDTAELRITVAPDDVPENLQSEDLVTDETDLNPTDSDSGTVTADFGNDGPGTFGATSAGDFSFGGSALGGNLTSNGQPVSVTLSGNTYTGSAGGQTIFTLEIQSNGQYTFDLIGTLDHADASNPNDIITLDFGVRATDADGDSADSTIRVNVLDDVPVIGDSAGDVDETNLDQGDLTYSDTIFTDFGSDVASIVPGGVAQAEVNGSAIALTSGGQAVVIAATANGYEGSVGGQSIFTLTINSATGQYDYVQSAPFDHPDATDHNDVINLVFPVAVASVDGDSDTGIITIAVADDGVDARDDVNGAEEGQTITGQLVANSDDVSEDLPNEVVNVRFGGTDYGVAAGAPAVITTSLGVLTVNQNGSYTFAATDLGDPDGIVAFTYTLRDGDGDTDTA